MPESRTALLLGATGLVGGLCLDRLLADERYRAVHTLGRRPLGRTHPKLTHHVLDFSRLEAHADAIRGQDVFCCLGTTRKQAGSKAQFRMVDEVYPFEIAKIALDQGSEQYLLVSALGADPRSMFFYNRVKGEAEDAISQLGFYGVYRFRPSLLTGDRDEARTGEEVAEAVLKATSFLLRGPLRKLRPTPARAVATALVEVARQRPGGVQTYEPERIRAIAEGAEQPQAAP